MTGEDRTGPEGLSFEQIAADAELVLVGPWQEQLRTAMVRSEQEGITTSTDHPAGLPASDQRVGTIDPGEGLEPGRSQNGLLRPRIWLAAAVLLIAGVGLSLQLRAEEQKQEVAATGDQQLNVADRFIDGFTAGETGEVMALFAPGAPIRYQDTSGSDLMLTPEAFESLLAFYGAQEAVIAGEECVDLGSGTIRCEWQLEDAVTRTAGQPGDDVVAEFKIVDQQIAGLDYTIDFFSEARDSFFRWVTANRPESDDVFVWGPDSTPAEGQIFGELVARYASEWAASEDIPPPDIGE